MQRCLNHRNCGVGWGGDSKSSTFLDKCKVVGKRINRGTGYGLEVAMDFSSYGDDRAIKWEILNRILSSLLMTQCFFL